jgi:hypothetical protein
MPEIVHFLLELQFTEAGTKCDWGSASRTRKWKRSTWKKMRLFNLKEVRWSEGLKTVFNIECCLQTYGRTKRRKWKVKVFKCHLDSSRVL